MFPLRDTVPTLYFPLATYAIILLNAAVFVFELRLPDAALQTLFHVCGIVPARFTHPEWAARIGLPIHEYWPFFFELPAVTFLVFWFFTQLFAGAMFTWTSSDF